jgi:hypothetical protein
MNHLGRRIAKEGAVSGIAMKFRLMRICRALCLLGVLVFLSCGGDDGPTTSGPDHEPPTLSFPQVRVNTNIDRSTEDGDDAYSLLCQKVYFANYLTQAGIYFSSFVAVKWDEASGCWSWSGSPVSGCTYTYEVCGDTGGGGGHVWRIWEDGSCPSSDTAVHWLSSEAKTSADGNVGSIVVYQPFLTEVYFVISWTFASDRKSGSWTEGSGPNPSDTVWQRVSWVESPDSSMTISWEITSEPYEKWTAQIPKDRQSGHLLSYRWDAALSVYYLELDMTWQSDGSGFLTEYDEDGRIVGTETWP